MYCYILAGGVFAGYLIRAVLNSCRRTNDLKEKIDILLHRLQSLDLYIDEQSNLSDAEYYAYLHKLEVIYTKYIELLGSSPVCDRIDRYWDLFTRHANEFATMDSDQAAKVYLDVIHNLANYYISGKYVSDQLELYETPPSYSNSLTNSIIWVINNDNTLNHDGSLDITNELDNVVDSNIDKQKNE